MYVEGTKCMYECFMYNALENSYIIVSDLIFESKSTTE